MTRRRSSPLDRPTVISIAGDIIDAGGLAALTLRSLAAEAGVTQPALYRHVTSLDDVWRELGLTTRNDLAAALAESTIGLSGNDAIRAVSNAWRAFGQTYPGRYRSTERVPVRDDEELEAAVQRVLDVIALSMRNFDLDADDLAHEVLLLRSALHGFVSFELGDGNPRVPPIDETFDRLVELLCTGVAATARTMSR